MASYREPLFSFDHPDGWETRTVAGAARSSAFTSPTIVVVREPRRPGDTPAMHAQRQLFEMRTIAEFGLHESSPATLGGQPAARIRYSYLTKDGRLEQAQTYAVDPLDENVMVSLLTTARVADLDSVQTAFDAALASVRFDLPPPTAPVAMTWDPVGAPGVPIPGTRTRR